MRKLISEAIQAALWIALLHSLGCATPTPTPDPGPGPVDAAPADKFANHVFDCDSDAAQSPSVLSPASLCLSRVDQGLLDRNDTFAIAEQVNVCALDLTATWPPDAVACAIRKLGFDTARSRASGDAGAAPRAAAAAARAWTLGRNINYRN